MAEMRVPAWLMPMKKTKFVMYRPQYTGTFRPGTKRPRRSGGDQAKNPQSATPRRSDTNSQKRGPVRAIGRSRLPSSPSPASARRSDCSTPFPFRQVDHLRARPELLEKPKCPRALGKPDHGAPWVVEVPEDHRARGAGLDAGRHVIPLPQRPALGGRLVLGALEPVMAEGALLHHAARPDGDVRVQPLGHRLRPLGTLPVEVPNGVRASGRAVPTADAARVDLGHEPFLVDLCRLHGADLRARGAVALHAGQRDQPETGARPVLALFERDEAQPRDGAAPRRLLGVRGRHVVLHLAGDDARLARGTPVEIDHHSPARHRLRPPLPSETMS